MRTFKGRLSALLAVIAGIAVIFVTALVPIQTASADQYHPEKATSYQIWWADVNSQTTDCSKVNSKLINVNVSRNVEKGTLLCSLYIYSEKWGVGQKTTIKVIKRSDSRVDFKVTLSALRSEDHYTNNGTGNVVRDTSEPWRMQLQMTGKKASSWLWQNRYTYRNIAAKRLSIGSLHLITQQIVAGEDKSDDADVFEARMRLNFRFKSTR